jgi:hypothetical protein
LSAAAAALSLSLSLNAITSQQKELNMKAKYSQGNWTHTTTLIACATQIAQKSKPKLSLKRER